MAVSRSRDRVQSYTCDNCDQFQEYGVCVHTLCIQKQDQTLEQLGTSSMYHFISAVGASHVCTVNPPVLVVHFETADVPVFSPERDDTALLPLYRALFTVSDCVKRESQRSRTIVRFVGGALTDLKGWACRDCNRCSCRHIKACEGRLRVLGLVPDDSDGDEVLPRQFHPLRELRHLQPGLEQKNERSVSDMPRPPIPFAVQPGELPTYFDVDYAALELLSCDKAPCQHTSIDIPRCRCGAVADDLFIAVQEPCTIYDIDRAYSSRIELHRCIACDQFSAGPDLGHHGLFNFDNRTIVSQRLLHKYDIYFSGGEGTFSQFCNIVGREYEMKRSDPEKFIHVDEFRRVWFSFVRLQKFDDNKQCPICKESPGCVIADGVTIATLAEKATGLIIPPTVPHSDSPVRRWTRPVTRSGGHQLVPNRQLRKQCIELLDAILGDWRSSGSRAKRRRKNRRRSANWTMLDSDESSAPEEQDEHLTPGRVVTGEDVKRVTDALIGFSPDLSVLATGMEHFCSREATSADVRNWLLLFRQVSRLSLVELNSQRHPDYVRRVGTSGCLFRIPGGSRVAI